MRSLVRSLHRPPKLFFAGPAVRVFSWSVEQEISFFPRDIPIQRGRSSVWLERWPVTSEVAGSSPVGPAIYSRSLMSLPKEFVHYISRRLVEELLKREMVEVPNREELQSRFEIILNEELSVEEKINEETRAILKTYAEEMRQTGVSYQEMFKRVKSRLVKEKKVIL
jgi:hypothetical protein